MCERALQLRPYIDRWLENEINLRMPARNSLNSTQDDVTEADFRDLKKLQLNFAEWRHLELITRMLQQFKEATSAISQSLKPQIQHIWLMYDKLFNFINSMTQDLE